MSSDKERRVKTVLQAMSDVFPGSAWHTNTRGNEMLDVVGGISIYLDSLALEIVEALDGEFVNPSARRVPNNQEETQ